MRAKLTLCLLTMVIAAWAQLPSDEEYALPKNLVLEMSTRKMRYHHYLWHQVRDNWNRFSENTKREFRKIGWEPPRPARSYDADGDSSAILDNDSGEDFLYMHRQMIETANSLIAQSGEPYGKVKGWKTIPAPGDKDYPVPPAYDIVGSPSTNTSTANRKTDNYYYRNIVRYEQMFKDPVQLRNMTLGELGARIDETIHGWIHMRWSGESFIGYRNSFSGIIPNIDPKFDVTAYDWLGDSYASHVNPLFWKIHCWVDDRIEDWRVANNLDTITWKGTWTGGPMSNLTSVIMKENGRNLQMDMSSEGGDDMNVLEEVFRIFQQSGVSESIVGDFKKQELLEEDEEDQDTDTDTDTDTEEVSTPPTTECNPSDPECNRVSAIFGLKYSLNNILYIFLGLYLALNVFF